MMIKNKKEIWFFVKHITIIVIFLVIPFSAWTTHIVTCIQTKEWGLLISGALIIPIGIFHGVGIWFGAW